VNTLTDVFGNYIYTSFVNKCNLLYCVDQANSVTQAFLVLVISIITVSVLCCNRIYIIVHTCVWCKCMKMIRVVRGTESGR